MQAYQSWRLTWTNPSTKQRCYMRFGLRRLLKLGFNLDWAKHLALCEAEAVLRHYVSIDQAVAARAVSSNLSSVPGVSCCKRGWKYKDRHGKQTRYYASREACEAEAARMGAGKSMSASRPGPRAGAVPAAAVPVFQSPTPGLYWRKGEQCWVVDLRRGGHGAQRCHRRFKAASLAEPDVRRAWTEACRWRLAQLGQKPPLKRKRSK